MIACPTVSMILENGYNRQKEQIPSYYILFIGRNGTSSGAGCGTSISTGINTSTSQQGRQKKG